MGNRTRDLHYNIYSIYGRENGRSSLGLKFRCRMLWCVLTMTRLLPLVWQTSFEKRSHTSTTKEVSSPKSRYRNSTPTFLRRKGLILSVSHPTCFHQCNHCSRFWRPPSDILFRLRINKHEFSLHYPFYRKILWHVGPFLGNELANTFPQTQTTAGCLTNIS
jgi:hypothetical protein